MKKYVGIILSVIFFIGVMGFSNIPYVGPDRAKACASSYRSGTPGGGDFAQNEGGTSDSYFNRPALTKEQAHDLVANHVKRWNPELEVGDIKDAGNFFAAEILSPENEIMGRLAVDKQSGRLMIIK
jgi:hypothetical protein